ncbi:hypothetical protein J2Y41_003983 [Arthrobacter sp. 1088]|nr:hypothetical protein [Arthrobacter sp. 1088]
MYQPSVRSQDDLQYIVSGLNASTPNNSLSNSRGLREEAP